MKTSTYCLPALTFAACLLISGCKKESVTPGASSSGLEGQVVASFVSRVAIANYQDIANKSGALLQQLQALNTAPTSANLSAAQLAWRADRAAWEQCVCFDFGPIDDNDYDTEGDTWPVDLVNLNAILQSNETLNETYLQTLPSNVRGFHAMEYLLFGAGDSKTAGMLTTRETLYLTLLGQDLVNLSTSVVNDWSLSAAGSYGAALENSGKPTSPFSSRQELFSTIAANMASACDNVANQEMAMPFSQKDSTYCQSVYSANTLNDFKNNIQGILNVYVGAYDQTGTGLAQLVAASDPALDKTIRSDITNVKAALNNITPTFELGIYTEGTQVQQAENTWAALQDCLNNQLTNFIQTNIKD